MKKGLGWLGRKREEELKKTGLKEEWIKGKWRHGEKRGRKGDRGEEI